MDNLASETVMKEPRRLELGGPVRHGSLFVEGRQEHKLLEVLSGEPEIVSLIAPRQSGKTTTLNFVSSELTNIGRSVHYFDLRRTIGIPDETNDDAEKFLLTLLTSINEAIFDENKEKSRQLTQWWEQRKYLNRVRVFCEYFDSFLPQQRETPRPEVIIFDELDLLHSHGAYTDVIFEGLRALYQNRVPCMPTFVLAGIVSPARLTKTVQTGNFSIGKRFTLSDFLEPHLYEQYLTFVKLRTSEDKAKQIVENTITLTGGQPYLTNLIIDRCASEFGVDCNGDTPQLVAHALIEMVRSNREDEPHFESPRDILEAYPADAMQCLRALDKIHEAGSIQHFANEEVKITLSTTGLLVEEHGEWRFKNEIYRIFFDKRWIENLRQTLIGKNYARSIGHTNAKRELPRVLIINCGGTIGMEMQANGEMGRPADVNSFFKKIPEIHEVARVFPLPLMSKDGINIEPSDWKEINEVIFRKLKERPAGIVVCMGTDSMSYVASACAFALGNGLNCPVVFTGAQIPNHLEHSDAPQNLLRSVLIAAERKVKEVCIVYNDTVFRAVRAEKRDDYRFDGFHSPTFYPLAVLTEQVDYREDLFFRSNPNGGIKFRNEFAQNIFKWSYIPGVPKEVFACVLKNPNLQGIVLQTPGVGNVPTMGSAEILSFIEEATKYHIPTLITSLYPRRPENVAAYQPAKAPLEKGAISAGNMTEPAAITKFMWIIARVERLVSLGKISPKNKINAIRSLMERDFVGEISTNGKTGDNHAE